MGSYLNEICAILFRTLQDPFHNIRIAFHLAETVIFHEPQKVAQ